MLIQHFSHTPSVTDGPNTAMIANYLRHHLHASSPFIFARTQTRIYILVNRARKLAYMPFLFVHTHGMSPHIHSSQRIWGRISIYIQVYTIHLSMWNRRHNLSSSTRPIDARAVKIMLLPDRELCSMWLCVFVQRNYMFGGERKICQARENSCAPSIHVRCASSDEFGKNPRRTKR